MSDEKNGTEPYFGRGMNETSWHAMREHEHAAEVLLALFKHGYDGGVPSVALRLGFDPGNPGGHPLVVARAAAHAALADHYLRLHEFEERVAVAELVAATYSEWLPKP